MPGPLAHYYEGREMFKYNGLLLGVCLLSGTALAEDISDVKEPTLKAIKIQEAQEAESIEAVIPQEESLSKASFKDKCFLAAKGIGAGAVSLLCGACVLIYARHYINLIARPTLQSSLHSVAALVGAAAFITASVDAYKYSADTLKDAVRPNT